MAMAAAEEAAVGHGTAIDWMETPLMINNRLEVFRFYKGEPLEAQAQAFVASHNIVGGMQCPPQDRYLDGTNTTDKCLVNHLVWDMTVRLITHQEPVRHRMRTRGKQLKAHRLSRSIYHGQVQSIAKELESGVQGRYYDLDQYFNGETHLAPHTAQCFQVMIDNLLGHEHVLHSAYEYLRAKARSSPCVDALYALADMLWRLHRNGRVPDRSLDEVRFLLAHTMRLNASDWQRSAPAPATRPVAPPPPPPPCGLQVVAVASDARPELEVLLESAAAVGLTVRVLGLGQPWRGLGSKVHLLREHLRGLPSHERCQAVLFVDAFDVMALAPAGEDEVLRRFEATGRRVLFGAETNSAPDASARVFYDELHRRQGTPANTSFLYLNSGT
jgi:hypothetical protein